MLQGEWSYWAAGAPACPNVVSYAGPVAARSAVIEHELWLQPSSLDGERNALFSVCLQFGVVPRSQIDRNGISLQVPNHPAYVPCLSVPLLVSPAGKAASGWAKRQLGGRVPKPDVVLTTYDHLVNDIQNLKQLPWDSVVLDLRGRPPSRLQARPFG